MRSVTSAILRNTILLASAGLVSGRLCDAQVDPWERIRLIEEGKRVSVTLHSGKTVNGKMEKWDPEAIGVVKGNKVVAIGKEQVAEVAMVSGMSRGAKAAIAGGVAGGVFAGLVGITCAASRCSAEEAGAVAAGGALIFGLPAAGIAALFGPSREVIYRHEAPPPISSIKSLLLLYSPDDAVKSGAKARIKIQLLDADGRNLSSPLLPLHAVGISPAMDPATSVRQLSGDFRYDPKLGGSGGYMFNLSAEGLEPGAYAFNFRVGSDLQDRTAGFRVK